MININRSYRSPNFAKTDIDVKFLILHYTAQDLKGTLDIFLNPQNGVSSHLVLDTDGQFYELVKCWDGTTYKTFHAGKSFWKDPQNTIWKGFNEFAIGIEIINWNGNVLDYTEAQYTALLEAIKHLQNLYPELKNPERILGHEHIAGYRGKSDPGYCFDWPRVFKEAYGSSALIKPTWTYKQHKALSAVFPQPIADPAAKKISILLEKFYIPFWLRILIIKYCYN